MLIVQRLFGCCTYWRERFIHLSKMCVLFSRSYIGGKNASYFSRSTQCILYIIHAIYTIFDCGWSVCIWWLWMCCENAVITVPTIHRIIVIYAWKYLASFRCFMYICLYMQLRIGRKIHSLRRHWLRHRIRFFHSFVLPFVRFHSFAWPAFNSPKSTDENERWCAFSVYMFSSYVDSAICFDVIAYSSTRISSAYKRVKYRKQWIPSR